MIYIVLSVLCSTGILIIFRIADRVGANTRHAITINYLVAAATGFLLFAPTSEFYRALWFWPAAVEGLVFYLIFRVMAKTTQISGVAATSIATKMSVVIPVAVGLIFLGEGVNALKIVGLITGLIAVVLAAGKSGRIGSWKWPLLAFLGTGFIDTSLKLFQIWSVSEPEFPAFIATIFSFAFFIGAIHHLTLPDRRFGLQSVAAGVVLGVLNFGTVYFVLTALSLPQWESSIIFPLNNFGVVASSTLAGVLLFREKLTGKGWIGLTLAALSIWLLYVSG